MKKIRFTLSMLLILCMSISTMAQSKKAIQGLVVDKDNQPIIGATILEKGTTNGTVSDINGKFTLTVGNEAAMLQITYVGYQKTDIAANSPQLRRIVMQESSVTLGEVVAIGYGQVKKNDATGSVLAIKAEDINKGMVTTATDLLIGKTAGVNITTAGGAPGSAATIRIRGGSSLKASNDPLIVIDGVPVDNESISGMANPLSSINPNDIESFSVLKDASATAIYGSRASNGVILITTKKGVMTKGASLMPKVSYSGNFAVSTPIKTIDVMTGSEYRKFTVDRYGATSSQAKLIGPGNTNWQDEILRTALSTDHNLSVTGVAGGIPYRVSGGYTKENGILRTSNMDRGTVGLALNPTFFEDHLKVNLNAKGMMAKNRFGDTGALGAALEFDPTQRVNSTSIYGNRYYISLGSNGKPIDIAIANPVALLEEKVDKSTVYRSLGNLQLDYKMHFLPELRANLNLGYDLSKSDGSILIPDNSTMSWSQGDVKTGKGEFNPYSQEKRNTLLDFYLNYAKELKSIRSRFDVMGGYSWQHFYRESSNDYHWIDGTDRKPRIEDKTESYLVSFFGRLNYTLMDKYLLTFTLRNDGSSRFAKENRWGLFPSAALAWKVNQEDFLKDVQALSDLKVRLGYGITGQQNITDNDYPYLSRYQYSESGANYMFGNQVIQLIRPLGFDPKLKWEETTTYNAGLDFGFLNGRITGSIDGYMRKTDNLINTIPVPAGTNFINELLTNVGSLENRGVEFNINGKPVVTKDLTWDLGFNISYNKNEITKLTMVEDPNYIGVETEGISGGTGNNIKIHTVGYPVGSYYVYKQIYNSAGEPIEGAYADLNGDGQITDKDLYRYKNAAPDVFMGLTSKVLYKAWDFSFSARSNIGNYAFNNSQAKLEWTDGSFDTSGFLKNRLSSASNGYFKAAAYKSDYYIQNASFLKVDNITLGYTFKNVVSANSRLRVYGTVQNPFIITKYKGLDPEISNGVDNNVYPRPRIYLVGLSVNF